MWVRRAHHATTRCYTNLSKSEQPRLVSRVPKNVLLGHKQGPRHASGVQLVAEASVKVEAGAPCPEPRVGSGRTEAR